MKTCFGRRQFLRSMATGVLGAGGMLCGCGMMDTGALTVIESGHESWSREPGQHLLDAPSASFRVMSYNIHHYKGRDGKLDPKRTARVIRDIDADVISLQEVDTWEHEETGESHFDMMLEDLKGFEPVYFDVDGEESPVFHGNSILTRFPYRTTRTHELTVDGFDHRSVVEAEIETESGVVRVFSAHLGLDSNERQLQISRLLNALYRYPKHRGAIVMGDFNEWFGESGNFKQLEKHLGPSRGPSTYPSGMPAFHLDRIWTRPIAGIRKIRVPRNPFTEIASDHLPIWADVEI